ncbi:MAG: hypothetical protein HUU50_15725 [Candidatus Brocadiae bacterium]|nr:hypothetical protein [Candidatus Brocadiia bacterium]
MNFFRKYWFLIILLIFTVPILCLGCRGGGSSDGGGEDDGDIDPTPIGTEVCNQCHYAVPSNQYVAGDPTDTNTDSNTYYDTEAKAGIGENYQKSVHYLPSDLALSYELGQQKPDHVTCEGCHGNGSKHYGVNDIPFAKPGIEECNACHNKSSFTESAHANPNAQPDKYFSQGSNGTDPAISSGRFLYKEDKATLVTKNERIQECSVCHQYSNKVKDIEDDKLETPTVACSACHDPHQPAGKNRNYLVTRGEGRGEGPVSPEYVINFKPQRVNNDPNGTQYGAKNTVDGTWIRPRLHFEYHVNGNADATHPNYAKQREAGEAGKDLLRLSSERLCASCHSKGTFIYTAFRGTTPESATAYTTTHAPDTYAQYLNSGHADKNAQPFLEFSLLSAFGSSRRPEYPIDMGLSDTGVSEFKKADPAYQGKNNFTCYQCHHGMASIDYMKGNQGTGTTLDTLSEKAQVIWGDSTVTCLTCHSGHKNGENGATTYNVRVPAYLSYNSEFVSANNPRGGTKKMMDLTAVPSGVGNSVVCLFCHQGRQSGWTLWKKVAKIQGNDFAYRSPNSTVPGFSTSNINYHYLAGGALLWSKNAWEFIVENSDGSSSVPKVYSTGNAQHQSKNCTGCHMGSANTDNTEGGHTWVPRLTTCQTSGCHPGLADFHSVTASGDYDGDGFVETTYAEIGAVNALATNLGPQWGTGNGGTGLAGLMNEALYDAGVRYTPDTHPYYTKVDGTTFTAWTPNLIAAAANLNYFKKTGDAMHIHNPHYAVQILIDSLAALGRPQSPANNAFFRPQGTRNATDYRLGTVE